MGLGGWLAGALAAFLMAVGSTAVAQDGPRRRVLTLADALKLAQQLQPKVRQAEAQREVAGAQRAEALAPLLPQVTATGQYQRTTANFIFRPGSVPQSLASQPRAPSFHTFDYFQFGVTVTQLIWDFGATTGKYSVAKAAALSQTLAAQSSVLAALYDVRRFYVGAVANRALLRVADEALANRQHQYDVIRGLVLAGARPEIDVVQARASLATAQVQRINADNNYQLALAQLNQAIGLNHAPDFDVAEETIGALDYEALGNEELYLRALKARPEVAGYEQQLRGQTAAIRGLEGAYGPALTASSSFTQGGTQLDTLRWNWNGGFNLNWPIFQGGLTRAQVREAQGILLGLRAQMDAFTQQLRLDVEQARLGVVGQKAALVSAAAAAADARERLRLAEGRYQAGSGSVLELGDAQLTLTNTDSQRVTTEFNLASARAQLMRAVGAN